MDNSKHIHIIDKGLCTGCSACEQICAHNAIQMQTDYEGFVYPKVDSNKCIKCGLCNKICPQNHSPALSAQTEVYAAYNKEGNTRAASTSGGMFSIFAQWVLSQSGVVLGAAFTDTWMVRHEVATNEDEYARFRGSKYVQSDVTEVYKQVKSYLQQDKWLLFSGTPCQIDGLKSYLRKDYEKLLLIDLICHGVPSPKLWANFLNWQKRKYGILRYERIRFRAKTNGWEKCKIEFEYLSKHNNHETLSWNWAEDIYTNLFERGISLRPSCYLCKYRCLHHPSDITLGDCWHYKDLAQEMFDDKGLSLIYFHTDKGKRLFEELSSCVEYKRVDAKLVEEHIVSEAGYYSEGSGAREFYALSSVLPIQIVAKIVRKTCLIKRIKNKLKKLINRDMAKKKVAIVALVNWECNYGNRLQNYALQTVVERLGFDVETINDCRYVPSEVRRKSLIKDILHVITGFRYQPNTHKKRIHFWFWIKRYRNYTSYQIRKASEYKNIANKYDYFITGSDQIWRPIYPATSNAENFLQFAPSEKRIAYAPSFGMRFEDFPKDKVAEYTKWLSEPWKALSIREQIGADAIKQMTGKEVPVLLDPTMLLTADDWLKIVHKRRTPKHYLLVNCLRTKDYIEYAKQLAERNGWEIIDIENDERYMGCSPSDFIYYISHAEHVLTNSFHCNVFSFLYHKHVTYYLSNDEQTKKITSRIETLLELVDKKVSLTEEFVEYPTFNWTIYEDRLAKKRKEALQYLSKALDVTPND